MNATQIEISDFPSLNRELIRNINHLRLDKRKSNIAQSQQIIESLYI